MARLPVPGSDSGTWGTILNDFLSQSINSDGTLKDTAVSAAVDAKLSAFSAHDTTGILTQTATDTFASRTITGTTNLISVTDGDGVLGNPTITVGSSVLRTDTAQTISGVKTFSAAPVIPTITNTGTLTLPTSTDTLVGRATTDTLTNKTITDSSNDVTANALHSATTTVDVSSATAPTAGQILTATGSTSAVWQTHDTANTVIHNWEQNGWGTLTAGTITAHGSQSFTKSVVDGRGRAVSTVNGSGSLREAHLIPGTSWEDSEMRSVIYPPINWDGTAANNAQQGHIHRVREYSSGNWEGIAIWTSVVFGGDYSYLHASGVRWDGTTLLQGSNSGDYGSSDSSYIDRKVRVMGYTRFVFGSGINEYTISHPDYFSYMGSGDTITIANMSDTTFNETDVSVNGYTNWSGVVQVVDPSDTTAVSYAATNSGNIVPSGSDSQKRWTPFCMATRVIGGTTSSVPVEVKRWRLGEPEPDWGDPRVRRGTVTSNANVTSLALGPGQNALWNAHYYGTSSVFSGGEWGDIVCRKL